YYTNTWTDGQKRTDVFETPTDYWFDYDPEKSELTLHVTLRLKTPLTAKDLMIQCPSENKLSLLNRLAAAS
ncbi:MAG: hypothetical protein WA478_07340, partial [Pseudolabrys sp.]